MYYSVIKGRVTGIFDNWNDVLISTKGYSGAIFKKFKTFEEAQDFIDFSNNDINNDIEISNNKINISLKNKDDKKSKKITKIFTDGSFEAKNMSAGYGLVIIRFDKTQYNVCGNILTQTFKNNLTDDLKNESLIKFDSNDEILFFSNCQKSINLKFKNNKKFNLELASNKSSNNIAELYAIYVALSLCEEDLEIYTDSQYVITSLTGYIFLWEKNGWKKSNGTKVANIELLKRIQKLRKDRIINFYHVKAHSGIKYNELADKLANFGRLNDKSCMMIQTI